MIRPVSYAEILNAPNASELMAEYAAECRIPELGEVNPQPELYALLEKFGGFQAFGVYDGEMLVGLAGVLTYVLPHYGTKISATESIFVLRGQRGMGLKLMEFIEKEAKGNGCIAFIYSTPVGSRFDRMMGMHGRHTNNTYIVSLV